MAQFRQCSTGQSPAGRPLAVGLVIGLLMVGGFANDASARPYRVNQVPNGSEFGCNLCHAAGGRTPLGLEVLASLDGQNVDWAAVFDSDSDGDGFTNGEELGDPAGVWRIGDNDPPIVPTDPVNEFWSPLPSGEVPVASDQAADALEDVAYEGQLDATDAEGDTLYYRLIEGPQNGALELDRLTGQFTYTGNENFFGNDAFTWRTFDGGSHSEAATASLTIAPVNDPPTIVEVGDQTVDEGDTLALTIEVFDVEDDDIDFAVADLPVGAELDADTGAFTWTPDYEFTNLAEGQRTVEVTFTASDRVDAADYTVAITVRNVSQPPTIDALAGDLAGNEGGTLSFTAAASDPDGEALTYTWDFGDGTPPVAEVDLTDVEHQYLVDGVFTVTLSVNEASNTVSDTLEVTIDNIAPTVVAGVDRAVDEGELVNFAGGYFDPGQDVERVAWDFGDGEFFEGNEVADHTYADDGEFTAVLSVSDNVVTVEDSIVITVSNVAPTVTIEGEAAVEVGEALPIAFRGAFDDPGLADEHTYVWDFGTGDTVEGDLAPTYAFALQGVYTVRLTVTDDDGGVGFAEATYTVVNAPPQFLPIDAQTVVETGTVAFAVEAVDSPADVVTLAGVTLPDGATFDAETGAFSWTPDYDYANLADGQRSTDVVFSASDGDVTVEYTVTITVTNANRAPTVANFTGDLAGDEGDILGYVSLGADEDGDPLTYTYDFGDGTDPETGTELTEVAHSFPDDGTFTVTLTVTDGADSASATLEIAVANVLPVILDVGIDRTIDEGGEVTLVATYFDPGVNDVLTYGWDYGDGGRADGRSEATHAYVDNGSYTATFTISDEVGSNRDSVVITVDNVAPVASAGDDVTVEEGTRVDFEGTYVDPGDDDHTYSWEFGNESTDDQRVTAYTYRDNGVFAAIFTVTDDDGGLDRDTRVVTVTNVAPEIVSDPVDNVQPEAPYVYAVQVVDPGDDELTYTLEQAPEGMEVSEQGVITWSPDIEAGELTIALRVDDDDGGTDAQIWTLAVGFIDSDGDGALDECENEFPQLDANNPNDGRLDFDNDGVTNADECNDGTNPIVSNAPSVPGIHRPARGYIGLVEELSLNRSFDPDDDPLTYEFQLSDRENFANPIGTWSIDPGPNRPRIRIDIPLEENSQYYWRARADDGRGVSPYSNVADFRYSAVNDPPTTPVGIAPVGRIAMGAVFVTTVATDPELGPVTYEFEIRDEFGNVYASVRDISGGDDGQTTWTPARAGIENGQYTWRARASDAEGVMSEWSAPLTYFVDFVNSVPTAPVIAAPAEGSAVRNVDELDLVAEPSVDDDDANLAYIFRIYSDDSFGDDRVLIESDPVPGPDAGQVIWRVDQRGVRVLVENQTYYWDVRARDREGNGPASRSSFRVDEVREPPGVPMPSSPTGGELVRTTRPTLAWVNPADPEGDRLVYHLEVYGDRNLTVLAYDNPEIGQEGQVGGLTQWQTDPLADNIEYFWRVQATDGAVQSSDWSDVESFFINAGNDAPGAPMLQSPADNAEVKDLVTVTLTWGNAVDPDRDALEYTVEIFDDADRQVHTGKETEAPGSGTTQHIVGQKLALGTYTWRVKAFDGDREGPWSDSRAFRIVSETGTNPAGDDKEDKSSSGGGCSAVGPTAPVPWAPWLAPLALAILLRRRKNAR